MCFLVKIYGNWWKLCPSVMELESLRHLPDDESPLGRFRTSGVVVVVVDRLFGQNYRWRNFVDVDLRPVDRRLEESASRWRFTSWLRDSSAEVSSIELLFDARFVVAFVRLAFVVVIVAIVLGNGSGMSSRRVSPGGLALFFRRKQQQSLNPLRTAFGEAAAAATAEDVDVRWRRW